MAPTPALARVSLASAFGDNMVLQRDMAALIWGQGEPGQSVTVQFAGQTKSTRVESSGRWRLALDPVPACAQPRTLAVKAEGASSGLAIAQCTNVLVGEVWVAAGQSNMEFPLASEAHAGTEVPGAHCPNLRLLNLTFAGQFFYAKPFGSNELARMNSEKFYSGQWLASSPETAKSISAIAYFFGREVQKELDVPIGLIHLAVGGSPTEAWLCRGALEQDPELRVLTQGNWLTNTALDDWCRQRGSENLDRAMANDLRVPGDDLGPNHPFKPGFLWASVSRHLVPMAARGVLWYQGESNSLEPRRVAQHEKLFPLMVRDWRERWGQERLPFLYCQLSGISTNAGYKSSSWPQFRDQQRRFLDLIHDTAMAVTSDIGHPTDVHPRNKRDVGHRLALAALSKVYGRGNEYSGPLIESATPANGKVILRFAHARHLHTIDGKGANGFEIGNAAGDFRKANAEIIDDTVVLTCADIERPKKVRYLWQPFPVPSQNLVNDAGLPASTFEVTTGP